MNWPTAAQQEHYSNVTTTTMTATTTTVSTTTLKLLNGKLYKTRRHKHSVESGQQPLYIYIYVGYSNAACEQTENKPLATIPQRKLQQCTLNVCIHTL